MAEKKVAPSSDPTIYHSIDACDLRRWFLYLFVGTLFLLVYGSVIPVKFEAKPFDLAWASFRETPWLKPQLYGRADWVANLLILMPVGWFGAAAIDWGRKSSRLLLACMPLLVGFLCLTVLGIEFLQSWFPPRTQSLNDIAAGCMGSLLGCLSWLLAGRATVRAGLRITTKELDREWLWTASLLYIAGYLLFAILPVDLVISISELEHKYEINRLQLLPNLTSKEAIVKQLFLSITKVFPLVLMVCFARGVPAAFRVGILFAAASELVQIPVFTRTASLSDFMFSLIGVIAAVFFYRVRRILLPVMQRSTFWVGIGVVSSLLLIGAVFARADGIITDSIEITNRWNNSFSWPMAGYYYQAEFAALTTITYKLTAFSWLGICFGLALRFAVDQKQRRLRYGALIFMALTAIAFELIQIFLTPHHPNAFDIIMYFLSASLTQRLTSRVGLTASGLDCRL